MQHMSRAPRVSSFHCLHFADGTPATACESTINHENKFLNKNYSSRWFLSLNKISKWIRELRRRLCWVERRIFPRKITEWVEEKSKNPQPQPAGNDRLVFPVMALEHFQNKGYLFGYGLLRKQHHYSLRDVRSTSIQLVWECRCDNSGGQKKRVEPTASTPDRPSPIRPLPTKTRTIWRPLNGKPSNENENKANNFFW